MKLSLFALAVFIVGFILIAKHSIWVAVGVYLLLWGNNVAQAARK